MLEISPVRRAASDVQGVVAMALGAEPIGFTPFISTLAGTQSKSWIEPIVSELFSSQSEDV